MKIFAFIIPSSFLRRKKVLNPVFKILFYSVDKISVLQRNEKNLIYICDLCTLRFQSQVQRIFYSNQAVINKQGKMKFNFEIYKTFILKLKRHKMHDLTKNFWKNKAYSKSQIFPNLKLF